MTIISQHGSDELILEKAQAYRIGNSLDGEAFIEMDFRVPNLSYEKTIKIKRSGFRDATDAKFRPLLYGEMGAEALYLGEEVGYSKFRARYWRKGLLDRSIPSMHLQVATGGRIFHREFTMDSKLPDALVAIPYEQQSSEHLQVLRVEKAANSFNVRFIHITLGLSETQIGDKILNVLMGRQHFTLPWAQRTALKESITYLRQEGGQKLFRATLKDNGNDMIKFELITNARRVTPSIGVPDGIMGTRHQLELQLQRPAQSDH